MTAALVAALAAALAAPPSPAAPPPPPEQGHATATVVAGSRYRAGALRRFLLGRDYRDLWTAPVEVEVLDLRRFAGGLTPVRRVGGAQTRGLALRGADGRAYTFRSVDKDPSELLPPDLRDTLADRLLQDQIAASHPGGALVASEITRAAGVITTEPRLVVLPDDAALGEHRAAFAGVLGTFEEYPQPGYAGATEILQHEEMWKRLMAGPGDRVDAEALLRARLVDLMLGDWDRHRRQWRWAKVPGRELWQPVAEDRDQAFSRYEGLVLDIGRGAQPRFQEYGPRYAGMEGLTWNGYDVDRWLLTGLEWPAWEETVRAVRSRVTDDVLRGAVDRLPAAYRARGGDRLRRDLTARRDALPGATRRYYEHLAGEVDVRATDRHEVAEVVHGESGTLDVSVRVADAEAPFFRRRFLPGETREVRLYLAAGNDRVVVRGRPSRITVRALGGPGNDVVDDQGGGGTRVSDHEGDDRVLEGPGTSVDRVPYEAPPPPPRAPWIPPRDWGRRTIPVAWLGGGPEIGAFLGGGFVTRGYAFRRHPYGDKQVVRAGWATGASAVRAEYQGELRRENSSTSLQLLARASGIEVLRFHGFGNETSAEGDADFFKVRQQQVLLAPDLAFALGPHVTLALGPRVQWSTTDLDDDRLVARLRPYGAEDFGQAGAAVSIRADTRDHPSNARRGLFALAEGRAFPGIWSAEGGFGSLRGEAATYLSAGGTLKPTLAVRVGGTRVFGTYPFHEAAFLGGADTVRGLIAQRYAGDSAAWGNAELRLTLGRASLVVPGELGLFGLLDGGRVWLEGEESDEWHTALGGGAWFSFLERANTLTVTVAKGEGRTGLYVRAGFAF